MKKAISTLVGTGIFLVAGGAFAQQYGWSGNYQPSAPQAASGNIDNIGNEGQLVFGVDRVMGVAVDSVKISPDTGTDSTNKATTISLFGNPGGGTQTAGSLMFPRLALDYFVVDSVSLGGSLVYAHTSTSQEAGGNSQDGPSTSTFGIAPRVGYAFQFDETFSLWPRAGITYLHSSTSQTSTNPATGATTTSDATWSGMELTAEAMLGISPFEHFAILIGPYVEVPLSGTASTTDPTTNNSVDVSTKITSFGLTTGIVGYY